MAQWYYNESGEQCGPLMRDEIQSLFDTRKITAETLVWTEGMSDWKPAAVCFVSQSSPYTAPASDPGTDTDWSGYHPSGPQVRPWLRFWARTCDFLVFATVFGGVIAIFYPKIMDANDTLVGVVSTLVYTLWEPLMFAIFGTTPFKALLGVRVRNSDGTKLDYLQALGRTFSVSLRGQGLGIPLVALVTNITSYNRLKNNGITSWDQAGKFTVNHRTIGWWVWLIIAASLTGFVYLTIIGNEL